MKTKNRLFLLILAFLAGTSIYSRETINFNDSWKFYLGDPENAQGLEFNDAKWSDISLPHDWAIEQSFDHSLPANTGKLPWKGVGWYRKKFEIETGQDGQQIYLIFDGIMAFPKVYINGEFAGGWDYGYNSFFLNITDYVDLSGTNVIAIKADTRKHDSRWYPGAGIYRKIQMVITDPVHVDIWGTYITTNVISGDKTKVNITTTVNNFTNKEKTVTVENHILDDQANDVTNKLTTLIIPANSTIDIAQILLVENARFWDIDDPVLYKVKTEIKTEDQICDIDFTDFGIRTIDFTSNDGFWLNGRRVQLKGVNLHHDNGPLGAKFYKRAMERQLEIMKEMGCNAVRTSHNVAAPELLSLCDSMGILVFDEIFDKWDQKADYLEQNDFLEFGERNIRNFIKRDRNHPSIFLWSVGNEMGNIQWDIDNGFDKLEAMVEFVRKYDNTRFVTMVCDSKGSAEKRHSDYYDVHCWNYGRRYLPARQLDTTKSVIISESASTLSTRGFYELPLPEKKTDFTNTLQVSSYDMNAPEWAEIADDDFLWQQEDTYVAGEFVWTGFDYLGEPTPYNDEAVKAGTINNQQSANSSYFGIVDMCGIPKDRYYLYKSYWLPDKTTVHILPHWNWKGKEGENIPVFVYTNGDCAELFLNGKSQEKRCKNPDSDLSYERFRLIWNEVAFEPGELRVLAYNQGELIGESTIKSAGEPYQIILTPDRTELNASGEDLSYILAEALDKDGNPCPLADNLIHFSISGPSVIEGVGNGNPQSVEPYVTNNRKLFFGKAMLIIRTLKSQPGEIIITATSEGLTSGETSLISN